MNRNEDEIKMLSKQFLSNVCVEQAAANYVAVGKLFKKSEDHLIRLLEETWNIEGDDGGESRE